MPDSAVISKEELIRQFPNVQISSIPPNVLEEILAGFSGDDLKSLSDIAERNDQDGVFKSDGWKRFRKMVFLTEGMPIAAALYFAYGPDVKCTEKYDSFRLIAKARDYADPNGHKEEEAALNRPFDSD